MTRLIVRYGRDAPTPAPRSGLAPHPRPCDKIYERDKFLGIIRFISLYLTNMSPALAHAGAGAASKDVKKESATARLLGSGKDGP